MGLSQHEMNILKFTGYKIRKIIFEKLSIRSINNFRRIKWFLLKPLVNDYKTIRKFYNEEVEIRILEQLFDDVLKTSSPVVLDVGANIGQYSYYLSRFVLENNGKCFGFEPRTDIYTRLKRNVQCKNFIAENLGLSNKIGFAELLLPTDHGRSSLFEYPEFKGLKSERVTLKTLDSYVFLENLNSIVFIKIDVEGPELEVLEGVNKTIQKYKPIILCEIENRHLIPRGKSVEHVLNYMTSLNYQSFFVNKRNYQFVQLEAAAIPINKNFTSKTEYYYNYWFIHKNDAKLVKEFHKIVKNLQAQ